MCLTSIKKQYPKNDNIDNINDINAYIKNNLINQKKNIIHLFVFNNGQVHFGINEEGNMVTEKVEDKRILPIVWNIHGKNMNGGKKELIDSILKKIVYINKNNIGQGGEINSLSKKSQGNDSIEKYREFINKLTDFENIIGEEYATLVQLKTLEIIAEEMPKIDWIDLSILKVVFEKIIEGEENHKVF